MAIKLLSLTDGSDTENWSRQMETLAESLKGRR